MVNRGVVSSLLFVCLLVSGHAKPQSTPANRARSAPLHVVPDLEQRLAKFREVEMPFRPDGSLLAKSRWF